MPDRPVPKPGVFIPLPQGLGVSGINTWAVDLAKALAVRGWPVAIGLHPEPPGYSRVQPVFHPAVAIHDLSGLARPGTTGTDLSQFASAYRCILDTLKWTPERPAVMLPTLEADCYAVAAVLCAANADRLRVIGWQHCDNPFDAAMMRSYEPMLSRVVGVSSYISQELSGAMPWRAQDVLQIPYGVEVSCEIPSSPPGLIRLVYAGRIEQDVKRIGVLIRIARILEERSVPFRMTLMGDGPASDEVDAAIKNLPRVRRLPPGGREQVRGLLAESDVFLLASRFEGLSISMLECLASGVVPIVTGVASGPSDAIVDGVNGLVVSTESDADQEVLAHAFADRIAMLAGDPVRLNLMRRQALDTAKKFFSHELHTDRCEQLLLRVTSEPPRHWPADLPVRFCDRGGGAVDGRVHGTVPPDADTRARAAFAEIVERRPGVRLAVYGTGRHTKAIAEALADHAEMIDCMVDDDPARHHSTCWGWPIVALSDLRGRGISDVVVSSWIHQTAMQGRCVAAGLHPHVLYESTP